MSPTWWGALLGATTSLALIWIARRVQVIRKPQLSMRVTPYIRDLGLGSLRPIRTADGKPRHSAFSALFGPILSRGAEITERVLGGSRSVRRRLERAGLDKTVHEFRIEQVQWGLIGFALVAGYMILRGPSGVGDALTGLVLAGLGFVFGVLARDNRLTSQVTDRERRILTEFPAIAELLALAVAAGESPVSALARVVERAHGEMSRELGVVLAEVRTGTTVSEAFDELASRTGLPLVARFAEGIAISVERGTPLSDVLHAQAADVRDVGHRELIESAARKEVLMMVPVVFLVLPITILFAFYPGFIGLNLGIR